ncbi:MAG TPA: hypothetical protein VFF06_16390 [Polyangia bacterium]|nr:hypothetical protein [Polyangia bacterium]
MGRRRWYTGLVLVSKTTSRTLRAFRDHGLGPFVPFVLYLLAGSLLLWVISAIAPVAPFVYSLF